MYQSGYYSLVTNIPSNFKPQISTEGSFCETLMLGLQVMDRYTLKLYVTLKVIPVTFT